MLPHRPDGRWLERKHLENRRRCTRAPRLWNWHRQYPLLFQLCSGLGLIQLTCSTFVNRDMDVATRPPTLMCHHSLSTGYTEVEVTMRRKFWRQASHSCPFAAVCRRVITVSQGKLATRIPGAPPRALGLPNDIGRGRRLRHGKIFVKSHPRTKMVIR